MVTKTSLKKTVNSRCLKLYRAYSISFSSSNVGRFSWSWILKDCNKLREKKKLLSCVPGRPRQNGKLAHSRCSRATTAKICTKKRDSLAKLLFCLYKPIAFCRSRCRRRSLLLKLPEKRRRGEAVGASSLGSL